MNYLTTSCNTDNANFVLFNSLSSCCLQGLVGHGTRHGLKVFPKLFKPKESELRSISINAIDFFPFGKPLFLV